MMNSLLHDVCPFGQLGEGSLMITLNLNGVVVHGHPLQDLARFVQRLLNSVQHQVDRFGSFEMAALEPAFIDSLGEPAFLGGSGQSCRFACQSNVTGGRKNEFHHTNYPPCRVETWSCRDQYWHFFASNHGEGLSFTNLARLCRFG